jgi:hypothetical protein
MSRFDHAAHLRLALECLSSSPSLDAAIDRVAAALREQAAAAGHPEKYHHTLTVFWMRLIARLLDPNLPLQYYSRARLFSDAARHGWLEPDLDPDADDAAPDSLHSPRHPPHRTLPR